MAKCTVLRPEIPSEVPSNRYLDGEVSPSYMQRHILGVIEGILMANRNWASGGKIYSMHVKPVMMTATVQIGATGAVTSFGGSAFKSVTRLGTGLYQFTAQANTNFNALFAAFGSMQSPVSGLSGISTIEIQNAPNPSVQTASGMVLTVKTLSAAGALADPASGSALSIMAMLSDSSVKIPGG